MIGKVLVREGVRGPVKWSGEVEFPRIEPGNVLTLAILLHEPTKAGDFIEITVPFPPVEALFPKIDTPL